MPFTNSSSLMNIIQRTLSHVDDRLVNHGERVAFLVYHMLAASPQYSPRIRRDACIAALLHDVGAYKTEEIDCMVQFEVDRVWEHSIYGSLFVKHLSPLQEMAPVILYHHTDYSVLRELQPPHWKIAQMVKLADRIDVYQQIGGRPFPMGLLEKDEGARFSPTVLALFRAAEERKGLLARMGQPDAFDGVREFISGFPLSQEEIDAYIRMIIFAIDFRSSYTVTHTITTAGVSEELGALLGLSEGELRRLRYGALLHDLGKISIPLEILESEGKLSAEEMRVMQTHVDITEEILGGDIEEDVARIALRHHEKLDGSGYPRGLTGEVLTLSERIVAVADIVSALANARSYKPAYGEERIVGILRDMSARGFLDGGVVSAFVGNYELVMQNVKLKCEPILRIYQSINAEYSELHKKLAEAKAPTR